MLPPPIDRVDVWTTVVDDAATPERLAQYRALVPADERARCDRFVRDADRIRFLIGRALARTMLSRYVPVDPRAWVFTIAEHGRPELAQRPPGIPDLRFNISHTDGLVACAAVVGREVGVDVEYIHRPFTPELPERFFAPDEVRDLRALPAREQATVFFDYWTLKEAYIKARGLGLALPLGQFSFTRHTGRAPSIAFAPELHDDPASWQFAQFWPTSDHRMGVAVRRVGGDVPIDVSTVIPECPA